MSPNCTLLLRVLLRVRPPPSLGTDDAPASRPLVAEANSLFDELALGSPSSSESRSPFIIDLNFLDSVASMERPRRSDLSSLLSSSPVNHPDLRDDSPCRDFPENIDFLFSPSKTSPRPLLSLSRPKRTVLDRAIAIRLRVGRLNVSPVAAFLSSSDNASSSSSPSISSLITSRADSARSASHSGAASVLVSSYFWNVSDQLLSSRECGCCSSSSYIIIAPVALL
mmetsp:Transcript_35500/g.63336  ORF Transcript_35500/g.63336 Transcript_35500/m.63336 type:complete len:225 (-) Transcript_35500:2363-3037(-)